MDWAATVAETKEGRYCSVISGVERLVSSVSCEKREAKQR